MISVFFTSCTERDERKVARSLLEKKVDCLCGDHRDILRRAENGRPYLNSGGDVSVSHSHGAVAVAVSCEKDCKTVCCSEGCDVLVSDKTAAGIGIDIETLPDKSPERCRKISDRFYFPEEKEILGSSTDDDYVRKFIIMWTKKEALFKTGMAGYQSPLTVNTESKPECAEFLTEVRNVSGKECAVCLCMIQKSAEP